MRSLLKVLYQLPARLPQGFWWMSIAAGPTLAAVLAWRTFNGLYGQDPYAYYDYAMGNSLIADLIHFRPLPPFFWPPGYPLLISFAALFIGPSPLAGQLVSLFMGIAAGLATALLAREVWVDFERVLSVPLIAGLLVTLTGQLWQSSVVVMSDTTGLAGRDYRDLGPGPVWPSRIRGNHLLVDARHSLVAQNSWLVLSAAALTFAVLTRWGYALVTIPGVSLLSQRNSKTPSERCGSPNAGCRDDRRADSYANHPPLPLQPVQGNRRLLSKLRGRSKGIYLEPD